MYAKEFKNAMLLYMCQTAILYSKNVITIHNDPRLNFKSNVDVVGLHYFTTTPVS